MIIIEGMDNTGKTSLQDRLCSEYGLAGVHSPGPHESDTVLSWIIESFNKDRGVPIIYDRFPLFSEEVYGVVLRKGNVFNTTPLGLQLQEKMEKEVRPLIIYCKPPAELVSSWGGREQMVGVVDNYKILLKSYDLLMETLRTKYVIVSYNYKHPHDYGRVLDKIDSHLQWWARNRFDKSLVSYRSPGPNRYYDVIKRLGCEDVL